MRILYENCVQKIIAEGFILTQYIFSFNLLMGNACGNLSKTDDTIVAKKKQKVFPVFKPDLTEVIFEDEKQQIINVGYYTVQIHSCLVRQGGDENSLKNYSLYTSLVQQLESFHAGLFVGNGM